MMLKIFKKLDLGAGLRSRFFNVSSSNAFTLIEMVIAITVFTIFIGFVMATYLTFHRAQQEAAITRNLILEAESTLGLLTDSLQENMIDYDRYAADDPSRADALYNLVRDAHFGLLDGSDALVTNTLYLVGSDGAEIAFFWDEENGELGMQEGEGDLILLHSEGVSASYVGFEIFPDVNPYESENISDDDVQFQPIVQVNLSLSAPGRIREEVIVDLQTSITSRFYQ
jgi:prepilin-type N-terminal cleavage/methylation domain-containing protein